MKPILKTAYPTAMRRGEILSLTWGQLGLKEGFIKLRPEDTKTDEGRLVPLCREHVEMFESMPRGLPMTSVFQYQGRGMSEMKKSLATACNQGSHP